MLTKLLSSALIPTLILLATSAYADELTAAKRNDIKALLDMTGARNTPLQMANMQAANMAPGIRQADPKFPEKGLLIIRDSVASVLQENVDKPNGLIESLIQSTHPLFSHEEIKGIVAFYQSPIGKKLLETQPKLGQDNQQAAIKWAMSLEGPMKARVEENLKKEGLKLPEPKAAPAKKAEPKKQ
jgi:hypothetical protein